jgi:hypothetical protein
MVPVGQIGVVRQCIGRRRQRGAVEDSRGFVADLLKYAPDGAVALCHAFLARRVGGLADAGHEGQRPLEGPNHVANADLLRCAAKLVAPVWSFAAVDQAAMLEGEQDVLQEFLGDRFLLG